jgi:hypothetical protein
MTIEQIETEIAALRQHQENQKKYWLRCGLAFEVTGLIVCGAVLLKVALTGENPPPTMIFDVLILVAVGLAFIAAWQGHSTRT